MEVGTAISFQMVEVGVPVEIMEVGITSCLNKMKVSIFVSIVY